MRLLFKKQVHSIQPKEKNKFNFFPSFMRTCFLSLISLTSFVRKWVCLFLFILLTVGCMHAKGSRWWHDTVNKFVFYQPYPFGTTERAVFCSKAGVDWRGRALFNWKPFVYIIIVSPTNTAYLKKSLSSLQR